MTTSRQPRPQPQATGMAATMASIGTPTNTATSTRCSVLTGSGSMSGATTRGAGTGAVGAVVAGGGGGGAATGGSAVLSIAVMAFLAHWCWSGGERRGLDQGQGLMQIRVRNRSLRIRRFSKILGGLFARVIGKQTAAVPAG